MGKKIGVGFGKSWSAVDRLRKRLWNSHNVTLKTKCKVCQAIVLTSLMHGLEAGTLYRRHVKKLNVTQMRQLRSIMGVSYKDRITNQEILQRADMISVEAMLLRAQFRWVGHVMRMDDERLPKQLICGQLAKGKRIRGGQKLRYKDTLKKNLRSCDLLHTWRERTQDRVGWRHNIHSAVKDFEANRLKNEDEKRKRRKGKHGAP